MVQIYCVWIDINSKAFVQINCGWIDIDSKALIQVNCVRIDINSKALVQVNCVRIDIDSKALIQINCSILKYCIYIFLKVYPFKHILFCKPWESARTHNQSTSAWIDIESEALEQINCVRIDIDSKVSLNWLVLIPCRPMRGIELYLDWYMSKRFNGVGHLLHTYKG